MFRFLPVLLASLCCCCCCCMLAAEDKIAQAKFEKHTNKKGGFSVSFPGKPKTHIQKAPSQAGELTIFMDMVEFGKGTIFIVSYNDYPEALLQGDAQKHLEDVRDGINGPDGEVLKDDKWDFGPAKLPARQVLIRKAGGVYLKGWIILKGNRLYQMVAVGDEKLVRSPEVEQKFFQSLSLSQ